MRAWLGVSVVLTAILPVSHLSGVTSGPRIAMVTLGRLIACHKGDVDQQLCKRECNKRSFPYYLCVEDVCHCSQPPQVCSEDEKRSCQSECAKQPNKVGVCITSGLCKCESAPCSPSDQDGYLCLAKCRRDATNNYTSGQCQGSGGPKVCVCLGENDARPCRKGDPDWTYCKEECQKQNLQHYYCVGDVCHCSPEATPAPGCSQQEKDTCTKECAKENKVGFCNATGICICEAVPCSPQDDQGFACLAHCKRENKTSGICTTDKGSKICICGNTVPCGPEDDQGFACLAHCKRENKNNGVCQINKGSKICICGNKDEMGPCKSDDPAGMQCKEKCANNNMNYHFCREGVCLCAQRPFPCDEKDKEACKQQCPKDKIPVCHHKEHCACENIPCGPEDDKGFACLAHCERENKTNGVCTTNNGAKICICGNKNMGPCKSDDPEWVQCKQTCAKDNKKYYECVGEVCHCSYNPFPCGEKEKEACKQQCGKDKKPVCHYKGKCTCEGYEKGPCKSDDPEWKQCKGKCSKENKKYYECDGGVCHCSSGPFPCGEKEKEACRLICPRFTIPVCYYKGNCTCVNNEMGPCKSDDPTGTQCKEKCSKENKKYYECVGEVCHCSFNPFPCGEKEKEACKKQCGNGKKPICHHKGSCTCENITTPKPPKPPTRPPCRWKCWKWKCHLPCWWKWLFRPCRPRKCYTRWCRRRGLLGRALHRCPVPQ